MNGISSITPGVNTTPISSNPISLWISRQPIAIREANARFAASDRPHMLMLNPQGYAGPRYPFSAKDSGGQLEYVNGEAAALAKMGFKVTVAARAFKPQEAYVDYGERRGASFASDNENIRYVYVPGPFGVGAPFIRKEQIYSEIDTMAMHLALFIESEAQPRGLAPWDPQSVWAINSHYIDGAYMGSLFVREWYKARVAEYLSERFRAVIPQGNLDAANLLKNIGYFLGSAVYQAYIAERHGENNFSLMRRIPADPRDVLIWAGKKLDFGVDKMAALIDGLEMESKKKGSFAENSFKAAAVGERLLAAVKEDLKRFRGELVRMNRHAWTPHSIGALKQYRMIRTGEAENNPEEYGTMNFGLRSLFEGAMFKRRFNPLAFDLPPVGMVVETSMEIGDAAFWENRPRNFPTTRFVPGFDPKRFYPRTSVNEDDVRGLFDDFVARGVVPQDVVGKLLDKPQKYNIVVEASRMDTTKRKRLAIESFSHIPASLRQSTYLFMTGIAGDDKDTKQIYAGLEAALGEFGISDRAFLVGRVKPEHMGALEGLPHGNAQDKFRLASFITTSRMEGWGMAAQEAVRGGLALVASQYTPLGTFLLYEADGVLRVEDDTPDGYARALQLLLMDTDGAREMAERGSKAVERHTWDIGSGNFTGSVARAFNLKSPVAALSEEAEDLEDGEGDEGDEDSIAP